MFREQITDRDKVLPDPPQLHFVYSFCIIDEKYAVRKTIQEFDASQIWATIPLNKALLQSNEHFGIELTIDNELDADERKVHFMKKIDL